jgi:hypothetical protein
MYALREANGASRKRSVSSTSFVVPRRSTSLEKTVRRVRVDHRLMP